MPHVNAKTTRNASLDVSPPYTIYDNSFTVTVSLRVCVGSALRR